jgi:hypothetical protein
MKLTLSDLTNSIKTKSEQSSSIEGLWIARSAVGIQVNNKIKPIFGFAAAFDKTKCEMSSSYELIEHIVFLPYAHTKESLNTPVMHDIKTDELADNKETAEQFLIGSLGPKGTFYGNGCAISTNMQSAIAHSKRELLERHLCCEIWYYRTRPLLEEKSFQIKSINPSVKIDLYTTYTHEDNYFSIAALSCFETGFFVLGAAVKENRKEALEHAASEAGMLFEDFKRRRAGSCPTEQSRNKVLSLREKKVSQHRKEYFQSLITNSSKKHSHILPKFRTVVFEPLPTIYAARTFSGEVLDPRQFTTTKKIPLMPLF